MKSHSLDTHAFFIQKHLQLILCIYLFFLASYPPIIASAKIIKKHSRNNILNIFFFKKKMKLWGQIKTLFWIKINWYLCVLKIHRRGKSSCEVIEFWVKTTTLSSVISLSRSSNGILDLNNSLIEDFYLSWLQSINKYRKGPNMKGTSVVMGTRYAWNHDNKGDAWNVWKF